MADRQWGVLGIQIFEEGEEEYGVLGVQVCEDQAAAAGGTLLIQMLQQGLYSGSKL